MLVGFCAGAAAAGARDADGAFRLAAFRSAARYMQKRTATYVILVQQSGPITLEGLPPGPPRGVGAVDDIEFFTVRLDSPLGRLLVGVDVRLVDHGFVRKSVAGARRVSMRQ